MKVLLLAAGRGTRISKYINREVPKSTLSIYEDELPLIRHTVENMLKRGIKPSVCVGFKKECIYDVLKDLPVNFYYNPFYEVTNSIASLWFMKDEIDDDLIVMNADVYLSDEILDKLIKNDNEIVLVSDKSRIKEGDYFFKLNENDKIISYGKELSLEDRSCEYVGLAKINKSFCKNFKNRLETMIEDGNYNAWWENVLYSFTDENEDLISTMDVEGKFWAEIDYIEDYQRIRDHVAKQKKISKNIDKQN